METKRYFVVFSEDWLAAYTTNNIDAEKALKGNDFTQESKMSDGIINPPHMIYEGAGLNNTKTKGILLVHIVPLKLGSIAKNMTFKGEIKKPKGYIY